ncbi:MAG: hypothetical protein KJZ91_14060 [Myxococcales bacterium]|nr:hypothetical protein [Myxococcales bacterium]
MYRNLAIELKDDGSLHIKDVADPLDLWEATRRFFKERRPVKTGRHNFTYPETTNRDVRQLAELWTRVHRRLLRWDLARARQHADEWKQALSQMETATAGAALDAPYAHNDDFWLRWTKRQAIYLSAVRDMPSKTDMIIASVKDAVVQLPTNVASGALAAAEATGAAAKKAGELAGAAPRGLLRGLFGGLGDFKVPLLVGAAVVGGVVLVPKLLARRTPVAVVPGASGGAS